MKRFFVLMIFFLLAPATVLKAEESKGPAELVIGRMKVSIMPEYDSKQVLVIYEGKFRNKNMFPSEAVFILPKGVTKLKDVCSLSPGGQHFCQLYKIDRKAQWSQTRVKLPYSDFFVDFQYAPFQPRARQPRNFDFKLHLIYPVDILEVNIQEPYRAKAFQVKPVSNDTYQKRDFTYYRYSMKHLQKGKDIVFNVSYVKDDDKPSVLMKFSPMAQPELMGTQRGALILVVGVIALLAIVTASFVRSKKRKTKA